MYGGWKGEGVVPSSIEQVIKSFGVKNLPNGEEWSGVHKFAQDSKLQDWIETKMVVSWFQRREWFEKPMSYEGDITLWSKCQTGKFLTVWPSLTGMHSQQGGGTVNKKEYSQKIPFHQANHGMTSVIVLFVESMDLEV